MFLGVRSVVSWVAPSVRSASASGTSCAELRRAEQGGRKVGKVGKRSGVSD